ncbi:MAG: hypothetical protein VW800_01730, partial [Acidimicrobiaceae bacterium]
MSETMNTDEAVVLAPARGAFDQDWRKLVNWGLICALALIFVSLTDMPDKLDKRVIVEPLLSMGYLSLIWIPIALGNLVTREVVLEGMTQHKKGLRELVAGVSVGAIGGAGWALLSWVRDTRDLRVPLV